MIVRRSLTRYPIVYSGDEREVRHECEFSFKQNSIGSAFSFPAIGNSRANAESERAIDYLGFARQGVWQGS
jgi:hypothetical protein